MVARKPGTALIRACSTEARTAAALIALAVSYHRLRRRAYLAVLRPHRDLDRPREIEHQLQDGLVAADVVMAVEMRGKASHERAKCVDLIAELDPGLVLVGARRGLARVADEAALAVHERRHAAGIRDWRAER